MWVILSTTLAQETKSIFLLTLYGLPSQAVHELLGHYPSSNLGEKVRLF